MGLEAELPAWMIEAVVDRSRSIFSRVDTVHGLKSEGIELEVKVVRRVIAGLWINELQFIASMHDKIGTELRTHTYPVDPPGGVQAESRLSPPR